MTSPCRAIRLRPRSRRGFTLLEVMVALGVLAVSYAALMQAQSASLRLGTIGRQMTVATLLARGKMELIEDRLMREGFPDMDQEEEGTFEDEGYPSFRFRVIIKKVELPLAEALSHLLGSAGEAGKNSGGGLANLLGGGAAGGLDSLAAQLSGQAGDLVKSKLGGLGGMASMLANPDMLKANVEMLGKTLEQALRLVQLTVSWGEEEGDSLTVTTHLVQVPQAASAPGATGAGAPGTPGMPGPGGPSPLPGTPGAGPNLPPGGLFGKSGGGKLSTGVFK